MLVFTPVTSAIAMVQCISEVDPGVVFPKHSPGMTLQGYDVNVESNHVDILACALQCRRLECCKSFSHSSNDYACQLHTVDPVNNASFLTSAVGYDLWMKKFLL